MLRQVCVFPITANHPIILLRTQLAILQLTISNRRYYDEFDCCWNHEFNFVGSLVTLPNLLPVEETWLRRAQWFEEKELQKPSVVTPLAQGAKQ